MQDRLIPLAGVQNFRDFGGYDGARGRLRRGRLFRSGHVSAATDGDLQRIGALGLSLVVDLRQPGERERQPNRWPAAFTGRVVQSDMGSGQHAPHQAMLEAETLAAELAAEAMRDFYRRIPFNEAQNDLARRYFGALVETDGNVLIHCAAGKDRTGFLCALTHAALGVHRDDIVEDFLLTNRATKLEERIPEINRTLSTVYKRHVPEAVALAYMTVARDFLDIAFGEIERRYASVRRYLNDHLQVSSTQLAKIEAHLLS